MILIVLENISANISTSNCHRISNFRLVIERSLSESMLLARIKNANVATGYDYIFKKLGDKTLTAYSQYTSSRDCTSLLLILR